MSRLMISAFSRLPVIKKESLAWQALQDGTFFSFSKRDLFLSWKYKHWVNAEDNNISNDFSLLILQNVDQVLKNAKWQDLAKPDTEYGLCLLTTEGSEATQLKFFQETRKEEVQYFNPKLLPEMYFNGILNKVAKKYNFRGHSSVFWTEAESHQVLFQQAILALQHHQQKGCLIIAAEESSQLFGAGAVLLEKETYAKKRGLRPKYQVQMDETGKISFIEEDGKGAMS